MLILFGLAVALAGDAIELQIEGLESPTGPVLCALYDSEERWLQDEGFVATAKGEAADGRALCRFDDVAPGTYAVSFFQDVDLDGQMDTTWMGLPKEPWGVSRDAPARFGPPKFAASSFEHPGGTQVAHVR